VLCLVRAAVCTTVPGPWPINSKNYPSSCVNTPVGGTCSAPCNDGYNSAEPTLTCVQKNATFADWNQPAAPALCTRGKLCFAAGVGYLKHVLIISTFGIHAHVQQMCFQTHSITIMAQCLHPRLCRGSASSRDMVARSWA
jgi:hypothetical protein